MVLAWRKRNLLIFAAAMALLLTLIPMSVYAQAESTVNATVIPAFVAVSALPTSVDYGVKTLGSTAQLPDPTTFVATNDGNITADFLVRGGDTADWTLAATADADVYVHRASSDGFTTTIMLTTTNQILQNGIASSGTSTVSLSMDLPTSSIATTVQTAPVIIVATLP
ncbi:MAG: hypothetical protein IH861_13885 [Chloroflexi bacterium]|nr:hypothetical protein [Chloroflexota bacterium]